MHRLAGRILVLSMASAPAMALLPSAMAAPVAAGAEAAGRDAWETEAVYKNDTFDRCLIGRTLDNGMSITFVQRSEGLTMLLASPHWELEPGKSYPVTLKLGPRSWDRDVEAKASSVSMAVTDAGLRPACVRPIRSTWSPPVRQYACRLTAARAPSNGSNGALRGVRAASRRRSRSPRSRLDPKESLLRAPLRPAEESPPPPIAKPAAETEPEGTQAEGTRAQETIVTSEEEPPAATEPMAESKTGEMPAEETAATSQEESPPSAAKPETATAEPAVKKASPKKKRSRQSSAEEAKRALKREVNRLRRFFGN